MRLRRKCPRAAYPDGMPTTVSPRGPLPARVYWTRRLIVLAVPLLLVVVLARVLGGSADGTDASADVKATQAGAQVDDTAEVPVAGPTAQPGSRATGKSKKNKKKKDVPVEPVLAEPTGPCTDSDIVATPAITSAAGGSDIPVTLNLRTVTTEACTWHVSAETLTVTITSGDDHIWSSRECPASIPEQDVVVRAAVDAPVVVTWSAKRSDETCSTLTEWAQLGFYHVEAAALGGEATDVQFEVVAPAAGVITKTAEPEQQAGKGKKNRNSDESHTPGEDGAGNSVG